MYAKSRLFKVKKLTLCKELATAQMLSSIEDEFVRHAKFQNETLEMTKTKHVQAFR
jgi:hypothetical protein